MSCCSNPDIRSAGSADWCENCGAAFSYENGGGDLYDYDSTNYNDDDGWDD